MKLDRKAIDLLMAKKCWNAGDLLRESGVSGYTFYRGIKQDITPKYVGMLARSLNAKVEDIIIKE